MKNKISRITVLLLGLLLLFSGCAKPQKDITFETDTIEISVKTDDDGNLVIASEEKSQNTENTNPVPESHKTTEIIEKEQEVYVEEVKEEEKPDLIGCSLVVQCTDVLKNPESLKEEKRNIIPENGIIYQNDAVNFSTGESAFDVLKRELTKNHIHLEFENTPMYNSAYIEGIGNLYEFDCGSLSGWMYRVNGEKYNYGSSQYKVKNGDKIEFYYICNFMEDNE